MKNIYKFILSFALLGLVYNAQAQITGDTSVCTGDIVTYHIPPVPGASYSWSVSGGGIMGASNVDSVMINWGIPGNGNLLVIVTPPNSSPVFYYLNIIIHAKPVPKISHAPYPGCPPDHGDHQDGSSPGNGGKDPCEKVCKYATITYTTALHPLSTYSWVATGALSISGALTNTVNVTWDASGVGTLTVYETNQWGCMDSSNLCVKKMNLPVAAFSYQHSVCKNSPVQFTNLSTGANNTYQWYFGDGGSSTLVNPIHTYTNGGTYTITLIAISECFCRDTVTDTIHVSSLPGPQISCPSTLCAFDTATYSTNSAGCLYNWFAIGGTIIGPNNLQTVTVAWGAGQLGHLGLHLTGCAGMCSDTTWIDIPIVPNQGVIAGPAKVCPGDCEEFSLPLFSGATYVWKLNAGACGQITDSSCCNKVQICWPSFVSFCNDTLSVTFFDAFLNCGGTARFIIHVRPKLSIFGLAQACSNGTSTYSAFPGINCNWSVSPVGPVISGSPGANISVNWNNLTGNFVIKAIPLNPNAVCNDSAFILVNVINPPQAPVITGDTVSCPNNTVQYCATGNGTIKWIIIGGTPSTGLGNCINVTWGNTPPFFVKAYIQMPLSPYCSSDTTTQTIHTVVSLPPAIFSGSHSACANATSNYATTAVYVPGVNYNWVLNPPNAGTITSPQGLPGITIEWGNNAPQTVILSLTTSICGLNQTDTFHIHLGPPPNPSIVQIGNLCPGVNAQLQAVGGVFTAFQWSGPSGYSSIVNPTTIALAGLYQLTVTDAGGCTALTQLTVFYSGAPVANITAQGPLQYCTGASYSVALCALGNGNYSYNWSNGPITQCINVTSVGSYNVTITDLNTGCYSVSNILSVSEHPCVPDTGTCIPAGSISFTHSSCNPKVFTNTSVNGSSFTWNFGDLTSSNLVSPTHLYTQAGFYTVTLYGYVPNAAGTDSCLLNYSLLIEIPLLAKFTFTSGCFGTPVCFQDQSVTTAGNSIANWLWNFGDATTSNSQNPCHTYTLPGTYYPTLTISNPGCTTSVTDTVVILPPPVAAFSFNNINCLNSPVLFTDLSTTSINYWNWNFGNGGTSLNQNPSQSYITPGFHLVTLTVHDIHGCYNTTTQNVFINIPAASGPIIAFPDTIVCAGTSVSLAAPACAGCTYSWSTGSTNDSITVNTTGIYSVIVTDVNGCTYSTFIRIIVNQAPYAVISATKSTLCLGDFTTLSVPYNINWLYQWISNDVPVNGSTNSTVNAFPASPGNYFYKVVITDTTTGCSDTTLAFILQVHLPPVPPTVVALGPTTVCKGDTITLVVTHPDPTVTFKWSTGETNDTIKVTKNGCLSVTATDTNGCTASTTFCVTVNPLPEVCSFWEGCYDTCSPYIIKGPIGAATYQWLLNGVPIPGATNQNYVANVGGAYSVIVSNVFGCIDTTGVLNLSLHPCPECSQLLIDSVYCDHVTGHYFVHYHIINHSTSPILEINLQALPPQQGIALAPALIYETLPMGATSSILTAEIFNGHEGDTICFRTHITDFDTAGNEIFCCNSDTVCITLPPCPPDTACCFLVVVHDSIWCETTSDGLVQYHFNIVVHGCGHLTVTGAGDGTTVMNNTYVMTGGLTTITGVYIPGTATQLCFTFVVHDSTHYCVDRTICFTLPGCPPPELPCLWEYHHVICQGSTGWFQYPINLPGTTFTWSFPGGIPSSATGMGPHYILYPNPGTFPVILTITNQYGKTDCIDSIVVVPRPVASIVTTGTTLTANPSGMSYQWYTYPVSNATIIGGATNQFYTPTATGNYCVVVTNSHNCADTACSTYVFTEPGCCSFHFIHDSIWCVTNAAGIQEYHFSVSIQGCGNMLVTTPNWGALTLNNPYTMTGGITVVTGTYLPANDNMLCLNFLVNNQLMYCADTTICMDFPPCGSALPCHLAQAVDISLNGSGNTLIALPAGMSYQWYTSPVSLATLIAGATNQFYVPVSSGTYCVVISNAVGCHDTVCHQFTMPLSGCCHFTFVHDSIWCETTAAGTVQYHFTIAVKGCGSLEIAPLSAGNISLSNPYTLQADTTIISGTYEGTGTTLCLLMMAHDSLTYCADTTICLALPNCSPPIGPCDYLTANFTSGTNALNATFTNTSTATNGMTILVSNWDFGDPNSGANNSSTLSNPSHVFSQGGTFTVCLYVIGMYPATNVICTKFICHTITIDPYQGICETLHALFTQSINGSTVQFNDQSVAGTGLIITNWLWNFGDPGSGANNTSNGPNPVHVYSSSGQYTVCLKITAIVEGHPIVCHDSICHTVNISLKSHLSGTVIYENTALTPINGASVQLWSGTTLVKSGLTNASGHYELDSIEPGTYNIRITTSSQWGGVNAADAALENYYAVHPSWLYIPPAPITPIERAQFYAGDVVTTNRLESADAGRTMQYFVTNGSPTWSKRDTWTFWPTDDLLTANPTPSPPNTTVAVYSITLGSTAIVKNFWALCTGDFNRSFVPSTGKSSSESLELTYDQTKKVDDGVEVDLPFYAQTNTDIGAMSLILNFPSNLIEVKDVIMNKKADSSAVYAVSGDQLRIGWFTLNPFNLSVGEKLFTLKLKVAGSSEDYKPLRFELAADPLNELSDDHYNTVQHANLSVDKLEVVKTTNPAIPAEIKLNSIPNPFRDYLTLTYSLPENGSVRLELCNILGEKVKTLLDEYQTAGDQSLVVDTKTLTSGMYTLRLRLNTAGQLMTRTIKVVCN